MRVNGGNAGLIRGCDGAIVKTGDQDISRAVDIQRCKDPHQLTRQGIIGTDEKLRKRIHPFQLCQKPAVIPVEVIICNDTAGFIILQTTGKNGGAETKPAFEKTQTVKGGAEKTYFLQMIFLDQVFDKTGQAKLAFGRQDISREVVFQNTGVGVKKQNGLSKGAEHSGIGFIQKFNAEDGSCLFQMEGRRKQKRLKFCFLDEIHGYGVIFPAQFLSKNREKIEADMLLVNSLGEKDSNL